MLLRTSYQRELNRFCKTLIEGEFNIREVTAGALTQARAKLNPWAFRRLNELAVTTFYKEADYTKWEDFRLLAVDGSVLSLPYSKSIVKEFGIEEYVNKKGAPKSLARCSLLYDVLNDVTIDALIGTYRTSEKVFLGQHLDSIGAGDLVLADRGYGTTATFHSIISRGADFCIRIRNDKRNIVKAFTNSIQIDQIVTLSCSTRDYKRMGLPVDSAPIKVRLIKVELEGGATEILCTTLLNQEEYPHELFKELYFERWAVEEAYKLLKLRIQLEAFSGRTARSIHQDFHAKILMMTLCATLAHPIAKKVREEYNAEKTGNKHDQKINQTDALSQTRDSLFQIFIKGIHQDVIDVFDLIIESARQSIRPGRVNRRAKGPRKRKPINFKQI